MPVPGEELPRHCRFCKCRPYATVDDFEADRQVWEAAKSDPSKQGKARFAKMRSAHAETHISQHKFSMPSFLIGMSGVIPELLHVGDLNVDKQLHKQGLRRHIDDFTANNVSDFYAGMGSPLKLVRQKDGNGDKWLKAAQRAGMILGNLKFPGGVAAWLPSLVLLVGKCMLQNRATAARTAAVDGVAQPPVQLDGAAAASSRAHRPTATQSLEPMMVDKYGSSLGKTLFMVSSSSIATIECACNSFSIYQPTPVPVSSQLLRAYD
eukprot:6190275-Pleurochrysis_carterae.AAC.1